MYVWYDVYFSYAFLNMPLLKDILKMRVSLSGFYFYINGLTVINSD